MEPDPPAGPGSLRALKVTYAPSPPDKGSHVTRIVRSDRCDLSNWESVRALLREQLQGIRNETGAEGIVPGAPWPFTVSYIDAEGDAIIVCEADEWEDFVMAHCVSCAAGKMPRITVTSKPAPSGPPSIPTPAAPAAPAPAAAATIPAAAITIPAHPALAATVPVAANGATAGATAGAGVTVLRPPAPHTPNGHSAPKSPVGAPTAPPNGHTEPAGSMIIDADSEPFARERSVDTTASVEDQVRAIYRLVELEKAEEELARSQSPVIDVDEPRRGSKEAEDPSSTRRSSMDRDYGTIQIHMAGINPAVQDHHIREFLSEYIDKVHRIHRRRETYCFIHFADIETAVEALNALDGEVLCGRHVRLELSSPTCDYFGLPPKPPRKALKQLQNHSSAPARGSSRGSPETSDARTAPRDRDGRYHPYP